MMRSLAKRWWYLLVLAVLAVRAKSIAWDGDWLALTSLLMAMLGMAMNVLVIVLNDGMPARATLREIPEEERSRYKPIDASTRLSVLADWIGVRDLLISPGDILIGIGVMGIILGAMLR